MNDFQPNHVTNSETTTKSNAPLIGVVLVAVIIVGGLYWFLSTSGSGETTDLSLGSPTASSESAVTNRTDLPEVVARVNGEEIGKVAYIENISRTEQVAAQQGGNLSDPEILAAVEQQALDQAINNVLLSQAAAAASVSVTDEEVEAEYNLVASQFPDEASFAAELENAALTEASLRENIKEQLTINAYIEQSGVAESVPPVTDAEVEELYNAYVAQSQGDIPELEAVAEQIRSQIQSQNEQVAISELIQSLRDAADIEILL